MTLPRRKDGRFTTPRTDTGAPTLGLQVGTSPAGRRVPATVYTLEGAIAAWKNAGSTAEDLPGVLQRACATPIVAAVWQSAAVRAWLKALHPDRAFRGAADRAWASTGWWASTGCRWHGETAGGAADHATSTRFAAWLAAVLDRWDREAPLDLAAFLGSPQATVWTCQVPHAGLPASGTWARLCHGVWRSGDDGRLARDLLAHPGTSDLAWHAFIEQEPRASLRAVQRILHEGRRGKDTLSLRLLDRCWVALTRCERGVPDGTTGPVVRHAVTWHEVLGWWPVTDARYPRIAARVWHNAHARDTMIDSIVRPAGWAHWPTIGRLLRADWQTPRFRRVVEIKALMDHLVAGGDDGVGYLRAYWDALVRDAPTRALQVWRTEWPTDVPRDAQWLAPLLESAEAALRSEAVMQIATTTPAASESGAHSVPSRGQHPVGFATRGSHDGTGRAR